MAAIGIDFDEEHRVSKRKPSLTAQTTTRSGTAVKGQRQPPPEAAVDAPLPGALAPLVAAATVFLASGAVLVLEILAVRLLAPYVGLTLETTTSIIGAALAGIALGAAVGGHLADRLEPRRLLAVLLLAGGCLTLACVPVVRALGPSARDGGDIAALGITLLALVPGATVLSAVSPTVARLQLRDLRSSGRTIGRLSAWATAGALVGTFGTGFVLVPLMPVSTAVIVTGAVVVLAGLAHGVVGRRLTQRAAIAAAVVAVAVGALAATEDRPCDAESTYHCARVIADPRNANGRELLLDEYHNSYVDLKDPKRLVYSYVRWIATAMDSAAPPGKPVNAVFVGGGAFTLPRWLEATRPRSRSVVLEVDKELVKVDQERLGLRLSPAIRTVVGDARKTLRERPAGSADVVVGDAFSALTVPWHLTTREWLKDVHRVLRPGGLYAMNMIDDPPLNLMRAELATLRERFRDVRMVTQPGPDGAPFGGNAVLLASDREIPQGALSSEDGAITYDGVLLDNFVGDAEPLRDDFAPVDQLLTQRNPGV